MNEFMKKPVFKWIILALIVITGFLAFRLWSTARNALPKGIASGNGRIESELVDIVAKEPLRVEKILVDEGDLVRPGQILVKLNTETLDAELAEAQKNVAAVLEQVAVAKAAIQRNTSEIELAQIETERSQKLLKQGAGSRREYDVRRQHLESTTASLGEGEAKLQAAEQEVKVAQAKVTTIQTRINDATLISPVIGRVLYRLSQPGEVLGAGGKALTLVDLGDVYMEIFLPLKSSSCFKTRQRRTNLVRLSS